MAEAVVEFVLKNLSSLLINKANLLGVLVPEIMYIRDEMERMKAFLRVADSKEDSDPLIEVWVRQVRDIAYDIEDVLDTYMLQFGGCGATGIGATIKAFFRSRNNLKYRHEIVSDIQTIKSRLDIASQGYQRYKGINPCIMDEGSRSTHLSNSFYDGRGDALLLEDDDIVGIENPKKQLVQWIFSNHDGVKVISVVGMGGLGKTTLVKKVYDDKLVMEKFDHHLWITISESHKVEYLLISMIKLLVDEMKQPLPQDLDGMNADRMRKFIKEYLQHKRYIVVLDDIWKIDAWEAIKYAFPRNMSGCIIVITTRNATVGNAMSCETRGHVYSMEPLPLEESMQLFYRKAFLGHSCPLRLRKTSESILRRCEGLPLAIVVIGALLATKNHTVEEWELFSRSMGDELERDTLTRMRNIISLSFYDLPYYLKSCFLYLSVFPEDELLEGWRLIQLWIAAGFVQEKTGKTLEEVALSYLNELINRSLIQFVEIDQYGYQTIRIHDLVREYVISKSRHEIVAKSSIGEIRSQKKIRRVALDASFNEIQESYKFQSLRSLLWFGSGDSVSGAIISKVLGGGCRLLKELDLRGAPIEVIPPEVFKLYHLKYLSLRMTKVKLISRSIKNLQNLETLDLNLTNVTDLPVEVINLQKLRHLLVYKVQIGPGNSPFDDTRGFNLPYEIGRLSSLQTLACLNSGEVGGVKTVIEIGKLTQLRELGLSKIRKKDGMELLSSLAKLVNLRLLILRSNEEEELIDFQHFPGSFTFPFLHTLSLGGRLEKIPWWIASLDGLQRLYLDWSRLSDEEDPLECLHHLPNLQRLEMCSAYEGEQLSFKAGGFQKLKMLNLQALRKLIRMRVEEGSMPLLEELKIGGCKFMVYVPEGIEHLSHLSHLHFCDMSEAFVNRLHKKRKGKNYLKIEHIRRVEIWNLVDGEWKLDGGKFKKQSDLKRKREH